MVDIETRTDRRRESGRMNQELMNVFQAGKEAPTFDRIKISLAGVRQTRRQSCQWTGSSSLPATA